jgi:hypothetical protein
MNLPDPEIPPLEKILETLAWLRETHERLVVGDICHLDAERASVLIEGFERLYGFVVEANNRCLSIAETARLVTNQRRKSRAIGLLKAFVTDLDAKGAALEKDRPPSPFGRPYRQVRLIDSLKKEEPFWTQEDCLAMRPFYLEWYKTQPKAKHGRKKS